jgi:anti-sigma B factor antagonist
MPDTTQYRSTPTDTMSQILEPDDFTIQADAHGDRHTLVLTGELDLASAPILEAATARLCADGASEIVVDLSGLAFIDSTGLRTILSSMSLCEEHLCNFWLIPGPRAVQRLFELAGILERLPFREPDLPVEPSQTG